LGKSGRMLGLLRIVCLAVVLRCALSKVSWCESWLGARMAGDFLFK
jgi:hypothetical protein